MGAQLVVRQHPLPPMVQSGESVANLTMGGMSAPALGPFLAGADGDCGDLRRRLLDQMGLASPRHLFKPMLTAFTTGPTLVTRQ